MWWKFKVIKDGKECDQTVMIWAYCEADAWSKMADYAYENGYEDFYISY